MFFEWEDSGPETRGNPTSAHAVFGRVFGMGLFALKLSILEDEAKLDQLRSNSRGRTWVIHSPSRLLKNPLTALESL